VKWVERNKEGKNRESGISLTQKAKENNDSGELQQLVYGHLNVAQDGAEEAGTKSLAGMNWNGGDSSVLMPEKNVHGFERLENRFCREFVRLPCLSAGEAESYGDLLDTYEFQWTDLTVIIFQAQLNHFACALHESVEVFRLGVATSEAGNCGDVTAVFVPFNDDREFARTLHKPILA
jgi:hypothetical protein